MDASLITTLPVTGIVPTANRAEVLLRTLESIAVQEQQPREIIIVDASTDNATQDICQKKIAGLQSHINYQKAIEKGAAVQRNQGLTLVKDPIVFFFDDDIRMEASCIGKIWNCLQSGRHIGGVNAIIINQQYHTPGKLTRTMYRVMSGKNLATYAGKCIGPAWNLLPEDKDYLPECNEVEWLNTTCTMYKMDALPDPAFDGHFKGYSLMEDLALSLQVAKKYKLYNVRNARIFHDSQPGDHKNSIMAISRMELVNRYYIMVNLLNRKKISDYFKLMLFELFGITIVLTTAKGWKNLVPATAGKFLAIGTILFKKR